MEQYNKKTLLQYSDHRTLAALRNGKQLNKGETRKDSQNWIFGHWKELQIINFYGGP